MNRICTTFSAPLFVLTFFFSHGATAQIQVWERRLSGLGESVGINPKNPNTLYAQDNNGFLVVSRNQGQTWSTVSTGVPWQIREIIVHPNDTLTLFITDFFNGLWKSTNAGSSWSVVISPYGIDGESVTYDPVHPDTMYAGNFSDGSLYRSTNRGTSWTLQGMIGSNLCALTVRPDSSNILLAGSGSGTISKSTNAGVTWHQVKSAGSTEIPKIVIDWSHPQTAYATAFSGDPSVLGVWKTTNGGENWFRTALQGINVWALDIDQSAPGTIYAGTFGEYNSGVYKTTDGGASWQFISRGFVAYNSMWNLHIDPITTSNLYMGATIGDFGGDGIFTLVTANAGIEGFVRDSLTNGVISSGSVTVVPPGTGQNLSSTGGKYWLYRVAGDTAATRTFYVYINSVLFKQETIGLISDSIIQHDLVVAPGSIRGTVYNDLNGNGVRDGGEPGLQNWTMLLSGQSSATAITDVNGDYRFVDLFPGSYTIAEQAKPGWTLTAPPGGVHSATINLATKDVAGKDFGDRHKHGVISVSPAPYAHGVAPGSTVQVTFDTSMTLTTFNDTASFLVYGKRSGRHRGAITWNGSATILTFTPAVPFMGGEDVVVEVTGNVTTGVGEHTTPYSWLFSTTATAGPGSFVGSISLQTGAGPFSVALGDLDGDGDADIVTANINGSNVSVLKNNGFGAFSPHVDYNTGPTPAAVALADVDLDGDLDIIVVNNGNSTISVLKNLGNGTFAPKTDYNTSFLGFSLDVTDLDGDGYPDVVVVGQSSSLVTILLNDHTGGFPTHSSYTITGTPWYVTTADLDTDGAMDVIGVSSGSPAAMLVSSNLGNGTLGTVQSYGLNANGHVTLVADLTNDQQPDLVATSSSANVVSVLPKSGSTFGPRVDVPAGNGPWGVAAGDLDGDGLKDLVVANLSGGSVSVLHNLGAASFVKTDYPAGTNPRSVAMGDLDGDGDVDVVAANSGTDSVTVYINSAASSYSYVSGWNLMSLPVLPRDLLKRTSYPGAGSNAFAYAGSYVIADTLKFLEGYWMKYASPGSAMIRGDQVSDDSIPVKTGWNMIGALSTTIGVNGVTTDPAGIIASKFYQFSGSYQMVDSLVPGQGFWVKTAQAGTLVESSSRIPPAAKAALPGVGESAGTVEFCDRAGNHQRLYVTSDEGLLGSLSQFELPPRAPEPAFDARFASGRILEGLAPGRSGTFAVKLEGAVYPVTVSWNLRDELRPWNLVVGGVKKPMSGTGSMTLASPSPVGIEAGTGAGAAMPRVYALDQNYPNPFNPSTDIRYALPTKSIVELTIVNALGQEVARLVDQVQDAGFHAVSWQPDVASGIYFYRLNAKSAEAPAVTFTALKKMLFVK